MNRKDILPRLFRFIKIRETGKRYLFPDVFSNIHLQEDCSNSVVLQMMQFPHIYGGSAESVYMRMNAARLIKDM